ncbi:hypothetical protein Tco_1547933 [Tanacetum coccineum]
MRTKPGVDSLSFDDLYNNLRVFESDIKGSTASSSSSPQNVAFVSENTSKSREIQTTGGGCMEFLENKDGSITGQKEDSKALETIYGEGVDWKNHSKDEDFALMA